VIGTFKRGVPRNKLATFPGSRRDSAFAVFSQPS
jgi:hypothetical protein